jgi:hypothetical protein
VRQISWQRPTTEPLVTDNQAYLTTLARLKRDLAENEQRNEKLRHAILAIEEIVGPDFSDVSQPEPLEPSEIEDSSRAHGDPRLKGATMRDAALIAFEKAKRPMRVREIYDLLMTMGYDYSGGFDTFKGSMFPTLNRLPEFQRLDTGLYALSVWPNAQKAQSAGNTLGLL